MKKILILITVISFASCTSEKLDMSAAKKTAESAIQFIGDKKFDALAALYTKDFNDSEPKETRELKLQQIIDAVGNVMEYKLTDSTQVNNTGEESRIVLKYKVKHSKLSTTETYTIMKDEGKYLLSNIDITNK